MAMEYVPGLTLRVAHRTILACGGRLPIVATLHVLRDVCAALQHLHDLEDANGRMGLLHRDVSPDNVILSTSGAAKLIDFGAARAVARTAPGRLFIGKYRYAAPERIRQQDEDCRSDVYSAGVMLYECLVGRRPFEGSDAEVVRAALSSAACDPCACLPDLAPSVGALVRKATAHNPGDRFASAGDLGAALAACLRELGASSRERDVTDALSTLLEATPGPVPVAPLSAELEAVPEAIAVSSDDSDMALSEREIIEASGPLPLSRPADDTRRVALPVPDEAFGSRPVPISAPVAPDAVAAPRGTSVVGWRTSPAPAAEGDAPTEPGVQLFDLGLQLRAEGRYWEALESWEKALALAPGNRLYQSQVQRLRRQLSIPRSAPTDDESRPASR
jgi:serine/threonine-protein kinase